MFLNLFSEIKNNVKNSIVTDDQNFKVRDWIYCFIKINITFIDDSII